MNEIRCIVIDFNISCTLNIQPTLPLFLFFFFFTESGTVHFSLLILAPHFYPDMHVIEKHVSSFQGDVRSHMPSQLLLVDRALRKHRTYTNLNGLKLKS